jgi:HAD superfamily phosphatase (TIGR01681 family)
MKQQVSNALGKLTRHFGEPLPELASRAFNYARETALAAIGLRACDVVGAGARCNGLPVVHNEGRIELGADVKLDCRWSPVELAVGRGGKLVIGDGAFVNHGALITARKRVVVGRGALIGNYSIVADCEAPGIGAYAGDEPKAIEIGDGAWIAARVTVLPGARIGAGAVVTAGSIVSGDIPAGAVAGGIPARVLRAAGATARAPTLHPAAVPRPVKYRGTLISDFTIDDLSRQLESLPRGDGIQTTIAPFGQVTQSLMSAPPDGTADFAVVWTRSESALPAIARSVAFDPAALEALQGEVDAFCELLVSAARHYRYVFVPTWTMPPYERGLGMLDAREGGVARALAVANLRLMENLAKSSNVYVLDAHRWVAVAGKNACNPKLWYLGKVAFHSDVFAEAARDIQAALTASTGGARKLLILDLDDTLWGGIVGDAGWENIRLGGHDGEGEAFVDFQHAVKNLTRRGVVLGIVSKNDESTALEAIRRHPEMVLRETDFVAHRINWADKAHNILELATELNLGLQSVVFIDDNPAERARVREALPEVLVPEWPEDKLLYRSALATLRCFDSPALSTAEREGERPQATRRIR